MSEERDLEKELKEEKIATNSRTKKLTMNRLRLTRNFVEYKKNVKDVQKYVQKRNNVLIEENR
ncbi:MAG: hypothetical protein CM15mV119_060 [uncultured marine virus]|nr:MAG: hypothetical protein CM15mV119_060 [uncultured marine virus]